MSTIVTNLSVSLDGFIAFPDDSVGDLFEWYGNGDVPVEHFDGRVSRMTPANAAVFRDALDRTGCFLVGRRLYDHTNGWNARPPAEAPMVVVTHAVPDDPPPTGVPISFAPDVEAGVAEAKRLAGGKDVAVAAGGLARSVLDAGLMDEIHVSLVPLVLGDGVPWLAGARGPVRLSDPEIVAGERVTHLRYRVLR